ncbi:OmpA family protein [Saprospiraceae bacterium]|nr:OmpA family protein [Saprospiraceae bacterium]
MTGLIIFLIFLLLGVIIVQIGRVSELASKIRGEEEVEQQSTNHQAKMLMLFLVLFLVLGLGSAYYYKDVMLGYGPLAAASDHGEDIDSLFNWTLFFTGIVFVITQILLFWFSYKYRTMPGRKAIFQPHNNTLEIIWTVVPAVVMTFLVVNGLVVWNEIMAEPSGEYLEIEATGYQFAWDIRYPGADNKLATKNFRLIDPATNPLGIDWSDDKSIDDVILTGADKIVLPVDTTVRVRITSKDVLHNFYLPHFRVKMDAIPGLPTFFVFRPITTTKEFRKNLKNYPEWRTPYDPEDPESKERWEMFDYELACAELCGKSHYAMRRIVEIVTREEYNEWMAEKNTKPYYLTTIRGTDADPRKGELLDIEKKNRNIELTSEFTLATESESLEDKIINLKNIFYEIGSATLDNQSQSELDKLSQLLAQFPSVNAQIISYTDNLGDADLNYTLSESRAGNVRQYLLNKGINADRLSSVGFGEIQPIESNDSPEARESNGRTELRIISNLIVKN